MTMPYERREAVLRTEKLLKNITTGQFVDEYDIDYEEAYRLIKEAAYRCIRHYPSDYYMNDAAKLAPEVFGEFNQQQQLTEITVGGVIHTANEGYYYARIISDDPTTTNYTLRKKS